MLPLVLTSKSRLTRLAGQRAPATWARPASPAKRATALVAAPTRAILRSVRTRGCPEILRGGITSGRRITGKIMTLCPAAATFSVNEEKRSPIVAGRKASARQIEIHVSCSFAIISTMLALLSYIGFQGKVSRGNMEQFSAVYAAYEKVVSVVDKVFDTRKLRATSQPYTLNTSTMRRHGSLQTQT